MSRNTPENKAKTKVKDAINNAVAAFGFRVKLDWHAGNPFNSQLVDCTGVIEGQPIAIEVKRFDTGGELTTRQKVTLREYAHAGSHVFLIDSEASLQVFVEWLARLALWKASQAGTDIPRAHFVPASVLPTAV